MRELFHVAGLWCLGAGLVLLALLLLMLLVILLVHVHQRIQKRAARRRVRPHRPTIARWDSRASPHPRGHEVLYVEADDLASAWAAIAGMDP